MVAKSGDHLLHPSARRALIEQLLPLATVVTPNVPEAEELAGMAIDSEASLKEAGLRIHALGPRHVLMKGGHLPGPDARDWLYDGRVWHQFTVPRIETRNTHGTGCTLASAIATHLGQGEAIEEAVAHAKEYVTGAMLHGIPLGHGHGPLNHAWRQR
jgi:hydroxymethylpyrimidine/phosphomethylpyrimidine kinase